MSRSDHPTANAEETVSGVVSGPSCQLPPTNEEPATNEHPTSDSPPTYEGEQQQRRWSLPVLPPPYPESHQWQVEHGTRVMYSPQGLLCVGYGRDYVGTTLTAILVAAWVCVPVSAIMVGATHRDRCRVEPNIPVFLVVFGAMLLLHCGFTLYRIYADYTHPARDRSTVTDVVVRRVLGCANLMLFLLVVVWYFVGCEWLITASVNRDPQADESDRRFCDHFLHLYTCALLITVAAFSFVILIVYCCFSCAHLFSVLP